MCIYFLLKISTWAGSAPHKRHSLSNKKTNKQNSNNYNKCEKPSFELLIRVVQDISKHYSSFLFIFFLLPLVASKRLKVSPYW